MNKPLHKQPIEQSPSKSLIEHINTIEIIKAPIADIACGYGRNGAYFVDLGYAVIFVDKAEDGLNFIEKGTGVSSNGDINLDLVTTVKMDLETEDWIFKDNSLGGIINVHYYNKALIPKFMKSLCIGGFLYIESIDARGHNYLQLPEYQYIIGALGNNFDIIYYKEKLAKPYDMNVATIKLLAVKRA
jgi:SAM-dependent methyltransferase